MWIFFFVKQKTAYELRMSDGSSDVCSSDLNSASRSGRQGLAIGSRAGWCARSNWRAGATRSSNGRAILRWCRGVRYSTVSWANRLRASCATAESTGRWGGRSEEHTSELQSLMRNSYAVFCLKKNKNKNKSKKLMSD